MADGEILNNESDRTARLDSISEEFKGILMDIHRMGDVDPMVSMVESDSDVSQLICNSNPESEETLVTSEDVEMISTTTTLTTGMTESESVPSLDILPTAVTASRSDSKEMFSTDFVPDWVGFGSEQQLPEGVQNGYSSFVESNGYEELSTDKQTIKDEPEDMDSSNATLNNAEVAVVKKFIPVNTFKIFVSSLPDSMSNNQLEELFKPYGNVVECWIFTNKNYAFVHMETEEGGCKAIKGLDGKLIEGVKINVQRSKQKSTEFNSVSKEIGTFKLFMSSLPTGVAKDYVTKLLQPYGRVVEVEIYRNDSAFVHMEEESAGRKVIKELNGKILPECPHGLNVTVSKNPEGPSIPTMKLQVKNLGKNTSPEIVRSLFQPFGLIIKCSLSPQKFGQLLNAVVYIEQIGDIRSALKELNGFVLDGNKLAVEPLFETETPAYKKERPFKLESNPGYEGRKYNYNYEVPVLRTPLPPQSFRGKGEPSNRGRGINPAWQLVPMPSMSEMASMPSHLRGRGVQRGRGTVRGHGRPLRSLMQPLHYSSPKRPYENDEFGNDYNFDDYYQDPVAANSRAHYTAMDEEYQHYNAPVEFIPRNKQPIGYSSGNDYHPPLKRSRGRGPTGMASYSGGNASYSGGNQLHSIMGVEVDYNNFNEKPVQIPYHPHSYPSLNFPLGEREYYRNAKQGNRKRESMPRMAATTYQNHQQQQRQNQAYEQQLATQQQKWRSLQQQRTNPQPNNYSNYLVPAQIPNSVATHSIFQDSTAYPSNYYSGVEDFNAVPFDYKGAKQQNPPQQSKLPVVQTVFPPGVNPEDYPNLKPGSKVYINGQGKVMVRGNRAGKGRKSRHPGLGNSGGQNNFAVSGTVSGANQEQLGYGLMGATSCSSTNAAAANRKHNKEQVNEDNQEYSEWLQQKSWLYKAIPGTVRPVNN